MSVGTYIVGLRDPGSKKHQTMVAAAEALHNAGVDTLPPELKEYFNDVYSTVEVVNDEHSGCIVDIEDLIKSGDRDECEDFIVELKSLPEGVTHIRVTNSY